MLLPGPEAQQLATYIGWLMHRTLGGLIAGGLFVVPGVVALMALSWISVLWGDVGVVAGLFFGLKAAVLALVIEAVLRVGQRALRSRIALAIAALAFLALFLFAMPFPAVVLAAAGAGFVAHRLGYAVGGGAPPGPPDPKRRRRPTCSATRCPRTPGRTCLGLCRPPPSGCWSGSALSP